MNIADAFFNNNGQLDWDAISTISNIFLATSLVIITLWNVNIFKYIIDQIKEITRIQPYKELDQSLWIYGKSL